MADPDDGTVQPDARSVADLIELVVSNLRGDNIVSRASRYGIRDERTHQHACDGCIAVGQMEEVRFGLVIADSVATQSRAGPGSQLESVEAGKAESPRILSGNSVDAEPIKWLWMCLQQRDDLRVNLDQVRQVVGVADARQLGLLFI